MFDKIKAKVAYEKESFKMAGAELDRIVKEFKQNEKKDKR